MTRTLILLAGWLALAAVGAAAVGMRFSQSLNPAEAKACGLDRLSSDQIAALDALVRRDSAIVPTTAAPAKAFSHLLSADEFRAAGLNRLTPDQRARLDDLVERSWADVAVSASLPGPAGPTGLGPVQPTVVGRLPLQIHGSVTLGYGWGSGGYSDKMGAMEINTFDPTTGIGVAVGYEEDDMTLPSYLRSPKK